MKNLFIAIAFLFATFVNAQNSLFTTISENDKYQEYLSVTDKDNDGFYQINDKRFILKFELKHLSTGEGYSISAIIQEGEKKEKNLKHIMLQVDIMNTMAILMRVLLDINIKKMEL
ncbi:hypothetical protein [Polaribacter ponticola]|uniref:Uncharacterized protein n=1 Tax=Polaribacter ponticola TaxID=2978475 RepID=A0ABT5S785_9FLAO|nr:hypothetical protein [Polaribacter sp. MSW5]MDD7913217.1 hypothetical protein [Polaribacter sp. MSW5]